MPRFLFSYRVPNIPLQDRLDQLGPVAGTEVAARWNSWIDSLGPHLVDRGERVSDARALGRCEGGTRPGGYSVVTAASLDDAVALARGCPGLEMGGGVEVGVMPDPGAPG